MAKKTSICDLFIKRQMGMFTKSDFDDLKNKASFLADTQIVRNQHIKVGVESEEWTQQLNSLVAYNFHCEAVVDDSETLFWCIYLNDYVGSVRQHHILNKNQNGLGFPKRILTFSFELLIPEDAKSSGGGFVFPIENNSLLLPFQQNVRYITANERSSYVIDSSVNG